MWPFYAMSGIHGELDLFKRALSAVNLSAEDNKLVLLTRARWVWLRRYAPILSEGALNRKAARLVLEANRGLVEVGHR